MLSLLALAAAAQPASAKPLVKPLKALGKQLAGAQTAVGKRGAARLGKDLRTASTRLRRKDTCGALKRLSDFVDRTKRFADPEAQTAGGALAETARGVQENLLDKIRGKKGCAKLEVKVRPALEPAMDSVEPLADGAPRTVTALEGEYAQTDFVENELVVSGASPAELEGLLERTDGELVQQAAPRGAGGDTGVQLVRMPDGGDSKVAATGKDLAADLRKLDPRSHGKLALESAAGLGTLAAAADEAARGLHVGINWMTESHVGVEPSDLAAFPFQKFLDGQTVDGQLSETGTWDAFDEAYLSSGAPYGSTHDYGVAEAWQNLEAAGRLDPASVDVAVIDAGFKNVDEMAGSTFTSFQASPEEGKERHGYFTGQTVAGRAENGIGAAGVAAPVASVRGIYYGMDGFSSMSATYTAINSGAPIINMSFGAALDAAISFSGVPLEDATQTAAEKGRLVIASAGNDGDDVDDEHCFIACWEAEWVSPCENDGVLCVGGMSESEKFVNRDPDSNYGFEACNSYNCSVKLFAPYHVDVLNLAENGVAAQQGTSFSAPYVAGVAALMLAADPSLTAVDLRLKLLDTAHVQDYYQTSITDPDGVFKEYHRWVDADAAVLSVLNWAKPLVGVHPVVGGSYSFGAKRHLRAVGVTQDGQSCCEYSWRSDKDGFLGTGQEIDAELDGGPGTRQITVTATGGGLEAERTFPLELTGNRPTGKITKPTEGQTLYRGITYKFQGSWTDIDHGFADGPCSSLSWSVDRGFGTPTVLSGCQPEITFGVNGQKTITLTVTDPDGQTDSKVVHVNVTDPPLNSPPVVSILSPDDGQLLHAGDTYSVRGQATDPDGTGPISYEWKVAGNGVPETVISTASQFNWRPADDVPSTCGNRDITLSLKATDPDGSTTESQHHAVSFGSC